MEQNLDNSEDDLVSLRKDDDKTSKLEKEELMDDEEAIDRLLMDEDFDRLEEPQESQIDEKQMRAEEVLDEIDEFADDDEFSDDADYLPSGEQTRQESDPEDRTADSAASSGEDDFLLANFDISGDEEDIDEGVVTQKSEPVTEAVVEDSITDSTVDETENLFAEANVVEQEIPEQPGQPVEDVLSQGVVNPVDLGPIQIQLDQLTEQLATLQEQALSPSEALEKLIKDQKSLKKSLQQSTKKTKLHTNIILAVAVLALLLAGGMAAMVFSLQTELEQLYTQVLSVEDEMSELDIPKNDIELKQLRQTIAQLSFNFDDLNSQMFQLNNKPLPGPEEKMEMDGVIQKKFSDLDKQIDENNKQLAALQAKISKLGRKKPVVKKTKASASAEGWAVNLVSFKKEWYANRKAAEFEKKGVPVEVEQVQIKGENWYRLRVSGFKTKDEASTYATRVKKALNLSSVWVTRK